MMKRIGILVAGIALLTTILAASSNAATTGQFWPNTGNGISLTLHDHSDWTGVLSAVEPTWEIDGVLDLEPGNSGMYPYGTVDICSDAWDANAANYSPNEVHFCNGDYGENGWLGVAIVWYYPTTNEIVIVQTLMNDFYLASDSDYLADANDAQRGYARQHVACQEVGHAFGIDHQKGPKADSCMNDMFGLLSPNFVSPNQKDYDSLESLYGSASGGDGGSGGDGNCKPNSKAPKCNPQQGTRGNSHGPLSRLVINFPAETR